MTERQAEPRRANQGLASVINLPAWHVTDVFPRVGVRPAIASLRREREREGDSRQQSRLGQ